MVPLSLCLSLSRCGGCIKNMKSISVQSYYAEAKLHIVCMTAVTAWLFRCDVASGCVFLSPTESEEEGP